MYCGFACQRKDYFPNAAAICQHNIKPSSIECDMRKMRPKCVGVGVVGKVARAWVGLF